MTDAPRRPAILSLSFHLLLLGFCAWIFTFPIFPTQDGSMHKYLTHVMAELLAGSGRYSMYVFRHPLPPYISHYGLMLGLSHFFSYDTAEKVSIAFTFLLLAYGFRYCVTALGPGGEVASFGVLPLLLHWSQAMGFMNYCLGIGLFFWAVAYWERARRRPGMWVGFVVAVLLLMVTHPVPLLILIVLLMLDIAVHAGQAAFAGEGARSIAAWLRKHPGQLAGFFFAAASFVYPILTADRSKSLSNLGLAGLHEHVLRKGLALYGISPYFTRSLSLWINLYRIGLYLLLVGALVLAVRGLRTRLREHRLGMADTFLLASVLLVLLIPVIPDRMNGAVYFATRMLIFVWFGLIAAAAVHCPREQWFQAGVPAFGAGLLVLAIIPGELFLRPVSRDLVQLEQVPLPGNSHGIWLYDYASMYEHMRHEKNLAFDPYQWAPSLAVVRQNDVLLNSPWGDMTNIPVEVAPNTVMLSNLTATPGQLIDKEGQLRWLTPENRQKIFSAADFILYGSVHQRNARGAASAAAGEPIGSDYGCRQYATYLLCVENRQQTALASMNRQPAR